MHGFSNLDLTFLDGAEVIQVRLGRWQLQLHFGSGATVSIECPIVHRSAAGEWTIFEDGAALGPNELYRLLGQAWVRAEALSREQLRVEFSGGDTLTLTDTADYESMQVANGEDMIVV